MDFLGEKRDASSLDSNMKHEDDILGVGDDLNG